MKNRTTMEDFISALTETLSAQEILAADISSDIANAITKRRISMGLSQSELAKKVGKSQATISKWENGDAKYTIDSLADIAVSLEMDLTVELKVPQPIQTIKGYRGAKSKLIKFRNIAGNSFANYHSGICKQM